jgi:DNA-binding response OmpR family regulator
MAADILDERMTTTKENGATILVADDDAHIVELVSLYLRKAGYQVETASDGDETLRKAKDLKPALLVLDVMMPGPDGLQVCRQLRRKGDIPIVLLTARSSDIDKIAGLRFGADDYVTKPFNPDELIARVDTVLRRAGNGGPAAPAERISVGDVEIDVEKHSATVRGKDLALTP